MMTLCLFKRYKSVSGEHLKQYITQTFSAVIKDYRTLRIGWCSWLRTSARHQLDMQIVRHRLALQIVRHQQKTIMRFSSCKLKRRTSRSRRISLAETKLNGGRIPQSLPLVLKAHDVKIDQDW